MARYRWGGPVAVAVLASGLVAASASAAPSGQAPGLGAESSAAVRAESAVSPCRMSGRAPCARLLRAKDKRGRAASGQKPRARGRNVVRQSGRVSAGKIVLYRMEANAAAQGSVVEFRVLPVKARGLGRIASFPVRVADVRLGARRGLQRCVRRQAGKGVIVRCVRIGPPKVGFLVLAVRAPRNADKQALVARAGIRGARGFSQVAVTIRTRGTPAPSPTPTPRPGPGSLTAAGAGQVCINLRADVGLSAPNIVEFRLAEVDILSDRKVVCRFARTDGGRQTLNIEFDWTENTSGACDEPRGVPFLSDGKWRSTRREITATATGSSNTRIADPEDYVGQAITRAEGLGVGRECE